MKDEFIPTQNYQKFQSLAAELLASTHGVELAAVTGRAGRGKSSAAEKLFATNPHTVYVLYKEDDSYGDLLREITFRLGGARPRIKQHCFEIINSELAKHRRLIMVDEADRMNMKLLNGLRNIHDITKAPIMLIGEDILRSKLANEQRLISRVRDILPFEPVGQPDVVIFYRKNLDLALTPEHAARLLRHCAGDFRAVMTDAVYLERIMKTSGLSVITDAVIEEVCKRQLVKDRKWAA